MLNPSDANGFTELSIAKMEKSTSTKLDLWLRVLRSRKALIMRRLLQDLGIPQASATSLFIDSQSAIKLAKNLFFHSKEKHVDAKYHHIRLLIAKDVIKPVYCPS